MKVVYDKRQISSTENKIEKKLLKSLREGGDRSG